MAVRWVKHDRRKGRSWAVWAVAWGGLFCAVTWLVQARLLAPVDAAGLGIIADHRQLELSGGMNWVFRLGFASVDAAVAVLWALWLGVRWKRARKPRFFGGPLIRGAIPIAAMAPMLLFAVIGIQAGLRLAVDQPAPGRAYELQRAFAPEPVSAVLDRTDAAARDTSKPPLPPPKPAQPVPLQKEGGAIPAATLPEPSSWRSWLSTSSAVRIRGAAGSARRSPSASSF